MATAALAEVAQATSVAVAGQLAVPLGIQRDRALTRFDRLLQQERSEAQRRTAQRLRVVYPARDHALLTLDWTAWPPGLRMRGAAVVVGRRAIPVRAAAFSKSQIQRSQNLRETTFLQLLVHTLHALDQAAVVVCDQGFRRVNWLRHCQELRQALVM